MSGGLWSGLTSYASGAISKAKEQLRDLALEEESDSQEDEASQNQHLLQKLKDFERVLKDKTQEADELQDMLRSHISEASESQRASVYKIESLEAHLADAMKNLVSLNIVVGFSDNAELQAYTQELDMQLKESLERETQLDRVVMAQEEEIEDHRVKEEALTDELMLTKEEHERLQEEHRELVEKSENIFNLNKKLITKVTGLKQKKEEAETHAKDLESELKAYKEELKVISEQLKAAEKINQQSEGLKDEVTQLKKGLIAREAHIEQLNTKVANLDSRLRNEVQSSLEYQRRFESLEEKNHALIENAKTYGNEAERLRKANAEMEQRLEAVHTDLKAHIEAAGGYRDKLERLNRQLLAADTQLKTTTGILDDREGQLKVSKEQLSQYEKDIASLQHQVGTLQALKSSFEQDAKIAQIEAERRNEHLKLAEADVVKYKEASSKLQELLEDFRLQLDSKDALLERLSTTIDEAEQRALQAEAAKAVALSELSAQTDKLEELEAEAQLSSKIAEEKVRQCNIIKAEAEALLQKFQAEVQVSEHYVDRRVINTFLVKFFNPASSSNVKQQMLETLANILEFSHEQREEVGLVEPEGLMSDFHSFITRED
mmetsp:Transcript_19582/g.35936  ORF Transcript_19582/g.35936 Transcript_19582/m.35936 type:complete len:606 (+) Transcript_19582:21-1838(+)